MNVFGNYVLMASIISFMALIKHPTKMRAASNLLGSIVAAACLGWMLWPFFVFAAAKRSGEWHKK